MEENGKKKRNFSPETREKLSRLAKERHADGRLGGPEFGKLGGRPKGRNKDRIAKRVAEAAAEEENAKQIINVFKDAINPSQPMAIRLKGAEAWAKLAQEHAKFELQEDVADQQQLSREELIEAVKKQLAGPVGQIVRNQLPAVPIPDAVVIEDD